MRTVDVAKFHDVYTRLRPSDYGDVRAVHVVKPDVVHTSLRHGVGLTVYVALRPIRHYAPGRAPYARRC